MEKRLKNIEDGYRWSKETAEALRSGNFSAIDLDSLIDEVESVYRGMERQLSDYLEDAFDAKLYLDFVQPGDHESKVSLVAALTELNNLLWAAPSVAEALTGEVIDEAYRNVRKRLVETEPGAVIPERCPYDRQNVLAAISALEFAA